MKSRLPDRRWRNLGSVLSSREESREMPSSLPFQATSIRLLPERTVCSPLLLFPRTVKNSNFPFSQIEKSLRERERERCGLLSTGALFEGRDPNLLFLRERERD